MSERSQLDNETVTKNLSAISQAEVEAADAEERLGALRFGGEISLVNERDENECDLEALDQARCSTQLLLKTFEIDPCLCVQ